MSRKTEAESVVKLDQPVENRASGADAATMDTAGTTAPAKPRPSTPATAAAATAAAGDTPAATCRQCITLSIFFDGTGNNLDADTPSREHSNVARLFRAHLDNDSTQQIYRRYVPGIGTYFKDVGDPGGTTTGRGMGAMGQKRLDWAFKELATILKAAEARANNPSNKIVKVRLAVFGFSRGAALARAFCRDLQKSCTGSRGAFKVRGGALGTSGMLVKGGYPIEVYFLGIFDTVASVGLPLSSNNLTTKRRNGIGWRDMIGPLGSSYGAAERDLETLAFGEPGADPSPGTADGHAAWASEGLAIADVVTQCVHMVSGHEMRNSFPLDSALNGTEYPPGTVEIVYPGVHSDVGGGYRDGEGGKSDILAAAPLREMLRLAVNAGVPMLPLSGFRTEDQKLDFAEAGASRTALETMIPLWTAYVAQLPKEVPLGKAVLGHMRLYWRYRLSAAVLRTRGRSATAEQRMITKSEDQFKKERTALEATAKARQQAYQSASATRHAAEEARDAARSSPAFSNQAPMYEQMAKNARQAEQKAMDAWREAQARLDTAANDSELLDNFQTYDEWLLEDAALLYKWHKDDPQRRMRPHYKAIVDAYDEVVAKKRPLAETSDLYRFFSTYVHDSLSGFATDNTRTTDPRVLYVGGDTKEKYAAIQRPGQPGQMGQMAA